MNYDKILENLIEAEALLEGPRLLKYAEIVGFKPGLIDEVKQLIKTIFKVTNELNYERRKIQNDTDAMAKVSSKVDRGQSDYIKENNKKLEAIDILDSASFQLLEHIRAWSKETGLIVE